MSKIAEFIKIYPGMANTVNLLNEFTDKEKNCNRMRGYKPIKSHREIIYKIARSVFPDTNNNRVYLLVGHYGTGKSHLLLMLANYFSQTLEIPEIKDFFNTFNQIDPNISRQIQSFKKGRHLVVIPRYESQEDFSENLLTALEEAFEREEIKEEIDSIYKEAIRTLEQWEQDEINKKDSLNKFSAFTNTLNNEGGSYNSIILLKNGLRKYEQLALSTFKEIYKKLIGTNFKYNANNIVTILKDVLNTEIFTKRFEGIVILYDEFDYTLSNRRISIDIVQQFAELCKSNTKVMFIGSLHKELSAFEKEYSVEDFNTVKQRFKTIDMKSEGLEEIVSAIVSIEINNPSYRSSIENNIQQVYQKIPDIKRLNLFDWLSEQEIQKKIIDAVYPLHPLTMACLIKLSTVIGSYNRTLFTFLGGEGNGEEEQYSYKWFINNNDIFDTNGLLNLYTPDLLVDYFSKELNINNSDLRDTIKKLINGYNTSLRELNNVNKSNGIIFTEVNVIYAKILKLMLVFELIGIINNETNIAFGLNWQIRDIKGLKNYLTFLKEQRVIFYNSNTKIYEFKKGEDIDWDNLIKTEKQRIRDNGQYDLGKEFLTIYQNPDHTPVIQAIRYNGQTSTDRCLLRIFENYINFGKDKQIGRDSVNYFRYYESELFNNNDWSEKYDGIAIYVITENDDDIRTAKEIAQKNTSSYIISIIPEKPISILNSFLDLKAALSIKNTDEYKKSSIADQSRLDESFIGDINKGYVKNFIDDRTKYIQGKGSFWFGSNGELIEARPHNEQDPVYKFFNNLFNKANRFNYEDFNYIHKKLTSQKEIILKEAVDHLLKSGQTIKIDTSFGNDKGFIKYLKKIFFDNQLLRKENGVGSEIICTIEKNYSKYINHFPALCDMIKEIESYQKINIKGFINKYKLSPYGLGNISLQLYLSFIIKYFGDELAYKRDPLNPGEIIISSSEQIKELISSSSPDAVFEKRVLDDIQKDLLVKLYQVFSNTPLGANEIPTIKTVIELTQQWFNNLPKISKSVDFYKERLYKEFIKMFELLDGAQGYLFIFHKLQTLWDYDSEDRLTNEIKDKIIEGIRTIKEQLYKTQENIENNIFQKYLELFEVKGTTYTNLEESINNWYNELDNIQKNINSTEHSKNSIPLIRYLKETNNIKQIIMELIPACSDYNLGKISEWNTDNTEIYINKIKDGIKKIDLMRIKVLPPIINIKGELKKRESGKEINIEYQDKNSLEVKISIPDKVKEVWVTYDKDVISIENSQKEIITSGEKLIIPDKILQKIRVVSVDKERNFSEERIIILEEKIKGVVSNIYGYSVEKPSSEKEIKTLLNGLIKNFINNDKIKKDEIINQLKEIIKDLENGC